MSAISYDFKRSDWGARPAHNPQKLNYANVGHGILHYPGHPGLIGVSNTTISSLLRGWQDYHMDNKNWSDIAYNVAVDNAGRLWELRGLDRRDGATSGMGGISYSILALLGNQQTPSVEMRNRIHGVFEHIRGQYPQIRSGYHSQYVKTSCPGDELRDWMEGRGKYAVHNPGPVATPIPAGVPFPLPAGKYFGPRYPLSNTRSVSGYYSHREDLRMAQERLKTLGLYPGVPDGLYGDITNSGVFAFQQRNGLTVDGLLGEKTWQKLFA